MDTIFDAFRNALRMIWELDADVVEYSARSLFLACVSTLIASLIGVPAGVALAENDFPGRRIVVTILNTLMGVPTVVIGVFVYCFICRRGPLGGLGLLNSVEAIIIGEVLLILPLITALTYSSVRRTDHAIRRHALALGATRFQATVTVLRESRVAIAAALIAGYGRVVGEIGVAMILGGNADHFTRTLTTAARTELQAGFLELALALGIVLLTASFSVNLLLQCLQGRGSTA